MWDVHIPTAFLTSLNSQVYDSMFSLASSPTAKIAVRCIWTLPTSNTSCMPKRLVLHVASITKNCPLRQNAARISSDMKQRASQVLLSSTRTEKEAPAAACC
jgi:hypothetical protein